MEIIQIDPKQAIHLINELDQYQESLYPCESNHLDTIETLCKKNVIMLGAKLETDILAIGAVKIFKNYGEIKRLYVPERNRNRGFAKRIMKSLEQLLIDRAVFSVKLETGVKQAEAICLYKELGYKECSPFGAYQADPLSVFMSKCLNA